MNTDTTFKEFVQKEGKSEFEYGREFIQGK